MEDEFIISEERHRELLSALRKVVFSVEDKRIDLPKIDGVVSSLSEIKHIIEGIKPSDNKELSTKIELLNTNIKIGLDNLQKSFIQLEKTLSLPKEKVEWTFTIERDRLNSTIKKVVATQK